MIRDIKTGYLYKCGTYNGSMTIDALKSDINIAANECTDTKTIILVSTITGTDVVVKYEFKNPVGSNGYIEKTVYPPGVANTYNITDKNNVNIKSVNFMIKNPDSLDCHPDCHSAYGQPSVFVTIKGLSGSELVDASRFYVQTFISQRLINTTNFKN